MTKKYPEYFEDFEVGMTEDFGSYLVTREEVIDFASKYDPQPFHLSDEAAKKTMFGKIPASGWHTCSMTMRMVVDQLAVSKSKSIGGAGIDNLRWVIPVYPGDTLRVRTTVKEMRRSSSKPMGFLDMLHEVYNQDDQLVMHFVAKVIMMVRPQ